MDLEKIEGLVKILESSSLNEMTIRDGDFKISMSKLCPSALISASGIGTAPAVSYEERSAEAGGEAEEKEVNIISPIVGTFYSASGPQIPPYVKVGDSVKAGDTVCILEAMKMMNEIRSDYDGIIKEIKCKNAELVEFDQVMFVLEKGE